MLLSTGINDSVGQVDGLEIIDNVGMTTLSNDKEIFVPVNNISIFTDITANTHAQRSRIVLLIDNSVTPDSMYVRRIDELKKDGFKFAISNLKVKDFEEYRMILSQVDYIYLDYTKIDISKAKVYFSKVYPNVLTIE